MKKKPVKKSTNLPNPTTAAREANEVYPLPKQDLDRQRERLSKAAAAGGKVLKFPAPTATQQLPAESAVPAKPLTTLEKLWPSNAAPKGQSNGPGNRALQAQKAAGTATAPKGPPVQSPSATMPEPKPDAAQAPKPTSPKLVNVTFALSKAGAKRVAVCGEFNGWSPSATPLKQNADGHWETTVALAPGRYEYKFVRDGEWIPDPTAHDHVWNQHGTLNSVIEVRA